MFWRIVGHGLEGMAENELRSLAEYVVRTEHSPGASTVASRVVFRGLTLKSLIRGCDVLAVDQNVFHVRMGPRTLQVMLVPDVDSQH